MGPAEVRGSEKREYQRKHYKEVAQWQASGLKWEDWVAEKQQARLDKKRAYDAWNAWSEWSAWQSKSQQQAQKWDRLEDETESWSEDQKDTSYPWRGQQKAGDSKASKNPP